MMRPHMPSRLVQLFQNCASTPQAGEKQKMLQLQPFGLPESRGAKPLLPVHRVVPPPEQLEAQPYCRDSKPLQS